MAKTTITKKQISEILQNNVSGVQFANKSLQRKFEKQKKDLERKAAIKENLRKRSAKALAANNIPTSDVAMVANFSDQTDQELLSAIIGLGVTAADLIDGKVDAVRALRLVKEAEKLMFEHQQRKALGGAVQVQAPVPPIVKVNS